MTPAGRVFLSAGEPSGDAHAAALARALIRMDPGLDLVGIGGPAMAAAGVRLVHDCGDLQAVGLVEAAGSLPAHLRALRSALATVDAEPIGLCIVVDYPGFHAVLAGRLHARGVPVVHYIAPQFWAWGRWRIRGFRRRTRHALVILPFEERFFRERDVPATFVGHPLRDCAPVPRDNARAALGLDPSRPVLGLFPGSRPAERARLWPTLHDAARRARAAQADLEVLVADGPGGPPRGLDRLAARTAPARLVAAAADAAIAKSGTTTLELALAGTPHVLVYRMHPLTHAVARRAVTVPWIGLVNLVAEAPVVPEFVQGGAQPARLAEAARELLDPAAPAARRQREAFAQVADRLGPPGASARAAARALELAA